MIVTWTALVLSFVGAAGVSNVADEKGWVEFIAARDLSAWRAPHGEWTMASGVQIDPQNNKKLAWQPGAEAAINGPKGRTANLVSTQEFGDVEAHIEFMIPAKSNSGIYFMGRYEVQVYDSHGVAKDKYPGIECGGIYPRWVGHEIEGHSPRVNAALAPGKWQTFDVVFRAPRFDAAGNKVANARFVKVVHNGKVVHENIDVTGPTRASLYNDEKAVGPLLLQGDHGPVCYRSVRIRPVAK